MLELREMSYSEFIVKFINKTFLASHNEICHASTMSHLTRIHYPSFPIQYEHQANHISCLKLSILRYINICQSTTEIHAETNYCFTLLHVASLIPRKGSKVIHQPVGSMRLAISSTAGYDRRTLSLAIIGAILRPKSSLAFDLLHLQFPI